MQIWVVGLIYPNGVERRVSCDLSSHKAALDWVAAWKSVGEQFENDTFRIVRTK